MESASHHEIPCTLCDEDGLNVQAVTYCSTCRMYLCSNCLRLHHRFPPNRTHQLLDITQSSDKPSIPSSAEKNLNSGQNTESTALHHKNDVIDTGSQADDELFRQQERHEARAREIEVIRKRVEEREEKMMKSMFLRPLQIPDPTGNLTSYVIGDLKLCLKEYSEGLFKYGSGIYDIKKFMAIVEDRIDEFSSKTCTVPLSELGCRALIIKKELNYVIYNVRQKGISKTELPLLLYACQVGHIYDPPREEYFRRMRDDIRGLIDTKDEEIEINEHYRRQLLRCLANIESNFNGLKCISTGTDPNLELFPIPDDVKQDPSVLRKWENDYYTCQREMTWNDDVTVSVPDDEDDDHEDTVDGQQDVHDFFVEVCASHVDNTLAPLDLTIDGNVPWIEAEPDLVKNDKITEGQRTLLEERDKRKPLSRRGMISKRKRLNDYFVARYGAPVPSENMFEDLFNNLETSWKHFEHVCS